MFWSPNEQFVKIRHNPLIIFPLIMVTVIYILASMIKAMSIRTEDLMLLGMSLQEADMVAATAKAFTAMSGFVTPIISILLATVIYIIIMKIARKETTFKQLFSMNTYIFVLNAVGLLINSMLWMITSGSSGNMITSVGGVLSSDSTILNSVELFSIWQFIITAIGFHIVGQLSKKASVMIVIILFILKSSMALLGMGALSFNELMMSKEQTFI